MTLAQIAQAVEGQLITGDVTTVIHGSVHTDSRLVAAGDVFVARRGEQTDGHLFAVQAVQQGASLVISERPIAAEELQNSANIVVADATVALARFATASIARLKESTSLRIVGITGSVGKTSTKNMIEAIVSEHFVTVANEKSFNNEVGAPLTMLRASEQTEVLISEMGANAPGDIARLVSIAPPNVGVVLAVGLAHAEGFRTIEATFETKSEMVQGLSPNDVAVLNIDDVWVRQMAERTRARVLWFGQAEGADVRADNISVSAHGTDFDLSVGDETVRVHLDVLGEHHVSNALAAVAVAHHLGISLSSAVGALERITVAAPGRMQAIACRDEITVINDAYNANPDSMSAALKTLAQIRRPGGRTIAVLGQMNELGEQSGEQHDRIGLLAVRLRIDQLVVIGSGARRLHISAINEGAWDGESVFLENSDEAMRYLLETVQPADTVIVKASNSVGLQAFADTLGEKLA